MEEDVRDPPFGASEKYYKCHPKSKVSFKLCIICENVYHVGDFQRLKNTTTLSEVLIICPEHVDLDITSTLDETVLNPEARGIIAQVKRHEKVKAQEEILKGISISKNEDSEEKHNLTTTYKQDDNFAQMKTEITLLRQLNVELQDKNAILKQLVEKNKEVNTIKTYAQAINKSESQLKHVPSLLVAAKKDNKKAETRSIVTNKIQTELFIPIKNLREKKDGSVIINCEHDKDVVKAEEILKSKIGEDFDIIKEEIGKPRLKVINIQNKMKAEELEQDINRRNFGNREHFCSVIHTYRSSNNMTQNAIIEVTSDSYKYIKNQGNKIYVGYQCCRVFDDLNVKPCYKCGRIGHAGNKCKNEVACLRCGANHQTRDCDYKRPVKCINCTYRNERYGNNKNIEHIATDTTKCEYLQYIISKKIKQTDYPIKPNIQTFLGYNGKPSRQSSQMESLSFDRNNK